MTYAGFELVFDYSDNQTQVIKYADMGLYLKVLPEQLGKPHYSAEDIALIATFYRRGLKDYTLIERSKQTHFLVLKNEYEKRVLWDEQLLSEAVSYYCDKHLSRKYDQLHLLTQGKRMPLV